MTEFCVLIPDGTSGGGITPPDPDLPPCEMSLVFEGDSMTLGAGITPALRASLSWGSQLVAGLPVPLNPTWLYGSHVVARGGHTMTPTIEGDSAETIAAISASAPVRIAVLWAGYNDIVSQGEQASTIYAGMDNWLQAVSPAITHSVLITNPPIWKPADTVAENTAYNTEIADLTALQLANTAGFTHVVDVGAVAEFQTPQTLPDPTRVDGVHMTQYGYSLAADQVRPTIAGYC